MSFLRKWGVLGLWLFIFTLLCYMTLWQTLSKKDSRTLLSFPEHAAASEPAGELVSGFKLEQSIDDGLVSDAISSSPYDGGVCADVLLANYYDRVNTGVFSLTLRINNVDKVVLSSAGLVANNAYHRFCFDGLKKSDLLHKKLVIVLQGVDSPPGQAVTAWLDGSSAGAFQHGNALGKSLIFSILVMEPNRYWGSEILLIVLCGLSGVFIFLPLNGKESHR
ncbi:hypothetical protein [Dyella silvatica]|uniref:hypothetical protein n=1 Tax=Dyella silvatica TaxID=2992128 RepID=UPI002255AAFE|nr:hypothetical protein [Dyella silvatica]